MLYLECTITSMHKKACNFPQTAPTPRASYVKSSCWRRGWCRIALWPRSLVSVCGLGWHNIELVLGFTFRLIYCGSVFLVQHERTDRAPLKDLARTYHAVLLAQLASLHTTPIGPLDHQTSHQTMRPVATRPLAQCNGRMVRGRRSGPIVRWVWFGKTFWPNGLIVGCGVMWCFEGEKHAGG